ncbi:Clp protease N-terminal domain-containing protein [Kitasatospora sp. NPDC091207]|uniref:Clp protease N-terminal domain-containing protein n=1 Tax=Kitasatospora sp. NPDC091207 TaxID=3364083 RepID=UPI003824B500
MFERFTDDARRVVGQAGQEAAGLRHGRIGSEHLLLAVVAMSRDPSAAVLVEAGLDHAAVRRAVLRLRGGADDAEALAAIGVDLDAVREAVESAFGEGALDARPEEAGAGRRGWFRSDPGGGRVPFTPRAKKVLELSLRESLRLKSGHIAVGHLLLGVVREGDGLGARIIADHGLDAAAVRRAVDVTLS